MTFSFSRLAPARRPAVLALSSLTLLVAGLALAPRAFSHGEQIAVGGGSKGPVHLTAAQEKTLAVQVAAAELRPLADLLTLNGEVQLLPGRQADVSPRISGQVTALYVQLGDTVQAGQRLARVQSRLVGNPPPSVDITAPRSGVVDAVNVAVGQAVEPATVLYRISDRSEVNIVAHVYEEDLGKVVVGQAASVRTLSYPDREFTGQVSLVGPTLDPDSRTVDVWVRVANPDGRLKPHLFARTQLVLRQRAATLAVPTASILEANGEKFVFLRRPDGYARIDIVTGASDTHFTEVSDGLVPGDAVVTQGNREIYTLWLTGGELQQEDD